MAIKVKYVDSTTEQVLEEYEISDMAIKALSTDMVCESPHVIFYGWHENAILEKIRRVVDTLCEKALGAGNERIEPLPDTAKTKVMATLKKEGYILPPPTAQMPQVVKDKIIELATVKTASERNDEALAAIVAGEA